MIAPQLAEPSAAAPPGPPSQRTPAPNRLWASPVVAVALLTLLGVSLRVIVAHQSLFADELSTYWISATHDLGGVMSLMYGNTHIPHAEITPPLYFVASWLTTQIGHTPELLRAPSLIAGALTIPAVYLLGLRTVRRRAAVLATALTALSPFMTYYSAEARSYAVMMLLVTVSTLAMLLALDTGRTRWWVLYAVCSCAALYTHYTCAFALFAQFVWLVWAHPEARRPAVLANLGVVVGLLPWTSGLINDFNSPTTQILSALSPFTAHDVRLSLEHWAIGFPYVEAGGLRDLPGTPALVLLGLAALVVVAGIAPALAPSGLKRRLARLDRRRVLVFVLLLSVPLGEALVSAVSTHIFGVRNLAASWPALALGAAVLLLAPAGRTFRLAGTALVIFAFALGAEKMLTTRYQRPDFQAAANFIATHARPGDVVIDGTGVLSPGPVTGLDVVLHKRIAVFRAGAPQERDHPYGLLDPIVPIQDAVARAVAAAAGGRVFVVAYAPPANRPKAASPFPSRYKLVETRAYPQFVALTVGVYADRSPARK